MNSTDTQPIDDWWKPEPSDPFWMLENADGEWLKNKHSLLGTRDASKALRFPTEKSAINCRSEWTHGSAWSFAKPTEHLWCDMPSRTPPTPATDEREAVARALCRADIGECATWDLDKRVDDEWRCWLPRADAALSALAPVRAAEILAAEARGYAKAIEDAANVVSNKGHTGLPYSTVAAIRALRNEHGAGK